MALQDLTPQLRTRLSRTERAAGWFVFVATALLIFGFAYYLYNTAERKGWFIAKARYYTLIQTASGLKLSDPVMLMGREAGKIVDIQPLDPWQPYNVYVEFEIKVPNQGYLWTDGTVAKVASSGFLDKRVIEVTKGTGGHAIYQTHPLHRLSLSEAEALAETNKFILAENIYGEGTNVVAPAEAKLTKATVARLAALKHEPILAFDTSENVNAIAGVWNERAGRYDPHYKTNRPYWLPAEESPAVSERLEKLANQVQQALPNFLAFTNQIASVLGNSANLTSNLNEIAESARPTVTNLQVLTEQLKGPGALGEWVLGTNLLGNVDTNLTALFESLGTSLENLADITSNLNAQVQANTNMLGGISQAVTDTDDLVQGLKRHWFLRSAFKKKAGDPPPQKGK